MLDPQAPQPPEKLLPQPQLQPRLHSLFKQKSWSPDTEREEVWLRRKSNYRSGQQHRRGHLCSKSVTDEDLEELKACIELGFGFRTDSPELDPKLSDTLPALEFYCAINKQYDTCLSRSSSSSSMFSDSDNSASSSSSMFDLGEDPETVKTKLKQWARVVACSARQFSGKPTGR